MWILKMKRATKFILLASLAIILNTQAQAQCPTDESEASSSIILSFVTSEYWDDVRLQFGLGNISESDIVKLNDINHSTACTMILDQKSSSTKQKYNLYFYKLDNRYINIMILKQPSDTTKAVSGLSFLEIYNSNYDRLEGYSF